jgi:hypothetical protein
VINVSEAFSLVASKMSSGAGNTRKSSLVDYSKVSNQPEARVAALAPATAVAPSAQMDAVMRMMTGREERTIAEKLADSNRPTWEQYKKEHHDKLHFDTLDQKEMEVYRQTLDAERDRRMAGLPVNAESKKDKKKSHKKKKKRRRHLSSGSESSFDSESIVESSSEDDSRHKHKKRHKKHHKRKHDKSETDNDAERRTRKPEKKRKRSKTEGDTE